LILFVCFIGALILTLSFIPPLIKLSPFFRLIDAPCERKVHSCPVPRIGGIAIVTGALIPLFFFLPNFDAQASIFIAIAILFFFGVWDDRADLDYRLKLLGQILSAAVVVVGADIRVVWMPFFPDYTLPLLLSQVLSIVALVGIINAMNLVDGLDGLAGGSTLIGFGLIAFLAFQAGDIALALLCMSIVGALLGFLRFNTHPASVFMGDAGSQFLGLAAGIACIRLTQQSDVGISPLFPLLLFAIPIFDTFVVMLRRVKNGKSPFSPDKNHIHHRFLAMGLSHYETVVVIYLLQGLLAVLGFYFRYHADWVVFCVIIAVTFCLFGLLDLLDSRLIKINRLLEPFTGRSKSSTSFKLKSWLFASAKFSISALFFSLFFLCGYYTAPANSELASLIAVLLLVFVITIFAYRHHKNIYWIERLCTYILCSTVIFFYHHIAPDFEESKSLVLLVFFAILLLIVFFFERARKGFFEISPLDYLVIFLTLLLAFWPGSEPHTRQIIVSVSLLIGLFYCVEYLLNSDIFSSIELRLGLILSSGLVLFALQTIG
jgi:UDP-GlcNAc:undecaprenyl-phosphate/decaprenyl-phosphate GlcNAc-1-phosphate transferase